LGNPLVATNERDLDENDRAGGGCPQRKDVFAEAPIAAGAILLPEANLAGDTNYEVVANFRTGVSPHDAQRP
jgi:hypothetical protein